MIGEQGGFGLVSLLRGLLGIITILGIAYAMSYWKDVARYLLS